MKDEFKQLSESEHMLKRPNMYIGSTSMEPSTAFYNWSQTTLQVVPGLLKIIFEILDNSIDEAIRTDFAFANEIGVDLNSEDNSITISDNGRGIPIEQIGDSYRPVIAWSKARAGSNFSDDDRGTIGMNGVGSFATNVFSAEFNGITRDGSGKVLRYNSAENATLQSHTISKATGSKRGTSVHFIPDYERFGLTGLTHDHILVIMDRLENLAITYPKIKFTYNNMEVKRKDADEFKPPICKVISNNWLIAFGLSDQANNEFQFHSYVNGLHLSSGGSHVDYLIDSVVSYLRPAIEKKWKIEIKPNHIKQNLFVASWLRNFYNMKFDSQTKVRLTNTKSEIQEYFTNLDFEKIAKTILNTSEIIQPIVQAILLRKEIAEAKEAADKLKAKKKQKIANHLVANSPNWEEKQLFLAEGLSALGLMIKVRDSKTQGGYALKGKVVNTHGMKVVDILKNKELAELIAITGLDLNYSDYDELEYGYYNVMTDADTDGTAIFCLLLQFFSRWPKLFKEGRIRRVLTPLYIAKKKGDTRWYYTQAEFDKERAKLTGYEISYNKGLGSLNEPDYEEMLKNPRFQVITLDETGFEPLELAFGDSADRRKEWMLGA